MIDFLENPPKIYHKKLQKSFSVIDVNWDSKMVRVKKAIITDGHVVEDFIECAYPFYDVQPLYFVGKKDDQGKDLIQEDEVLFGDRFEFTGVIVWNNQYLTWMIRITSTPSESTQYQHKQMFERLSDIDSKNIHFLSHKHGEKDHE